jgi:hypothetical protein
MKRSVTAPKKRTSSVAAAKKRPIKAGLTRPPSHQRSNRSSKSKLPKRPLLVHVRHTGKLLPHSATSYPLLAFLVLLVGVLMVVCSSMAAASNPGPVSDSYVVNAVVPGTAPSGPAVITSPVDQDRFSTVPITVSGTCPTNAAYIKLYKNDFFSGAALCNSGQFSLQTDLFPGANQLKARVYNGADIEGPVSAPVTVYYDLKDFVIQQPSNTSSGITNPVNTQVKGSASQAGSVPAPASLIISADYLYRAYYVNQQIEWQIGLSGGVPPYSVHVDWGDGKDTIYRQTTEGKLSIEHTYSTPVSKKTAYIIKITATDSEGRASFVQLVVLVTTPGAYGSVATSGNTGSTNTPLGFLERFVPYAWKIYGVTMIMLISFWLGEHREFNLLRNHLRSPKRFRGA